MSQRELLSDLMLNYWRSQELDLSKVTADDEARADAYRNRIARQLEAFMNATTDLIKMSEAGLPAEVASVVLRTTHRTNQTDIIRSAFLIVQAFAKLELGTDARNETAIGLCKDVVAGFEDRLGFWRI